MLHSFSGFPSLHLNLSNGSFTRISAQFTASLELDRSFRKPGLVSCSRLTGKENGEYEIYRRACDRISESREGFLIQIMNVGK
ncbi:hypothetical protein L1887_39172 [Cichorium endivia]|nr:hypothetical protein L1887_39172 [Cichorium endivia]